MEPKNIERLFQEKLKDLEMTPNPAVWNKIEQSMATPKKAKKGFIWYLSGSVAALLLLGFFLFNNTNEIKNQSPEINKIVENKNEIDSTSTKKSNLKKELKPVIANINKVDIIKKPITTTPKNNTVTTVEKKPEVKNIDITSNKKEITENRIVEKTDIKLTPNNNIVTKNIPEKQDLATVVNKEPVMVKNHSKHWSIAPVVSELFYNTLSNKSPVDSRLDNANKNGESSTSFGLKIAYQASKKWRIQTGIHKIDLAQTTENVAIASISRNSSFANSSQAISSPSIAKNTEINTAVDNKKANELVQNNINTNQLRQSFGYIEIPIEVNYQLFTSNKLQLHLVGGLSSLFLTQNNLQIQNPNYSYSDGEATNLNDVNFSFNLGTAVEYHFSNSWFFNLSPMLKMQTQTFNNANNHPYLLGVSTGINYKF